MNAGTGRLLIARTAIYGIMAVATVSGAAAGQEADAARRKSRVEIVRFANVPVTIVRGTGEPDMSARSVTPPIAAMPIVGRTVEWVAFAGPAARSVTIVRGTAAMDGASPGDAFLPPSAFDFERIAEAVHGVESSYGADPAMWRPDPDGPQGPMQVSAAAAHDTGGGNRFDPRENRLLGRAYLARMLRRYGNWPDALAAYNWGPGNVDRWVAGGRDAARLPLETTRYIGRVLRDARIAAAIGDAGPPITR